MKKIQLQNDKGEVLSNYLITGINGRNVRVLPVDANFQLLDNAVQIEIKNEDIISRKTGPVEIWKIKRKK
jgi:hypothetical protein